MLQYLIYCNFYNLFSFLGALLLSVQDSAAAEEVEQVTQPDALAHDSAVNLLSSGLLFRVLLKWY